MTTVISERFEASVDACAGGLSNEELLARVLDDATVASLAEQAPGAGCGPVGTGRSAAAADQAVPGGHIGG
jgi:hypothetical protein